LSSKGKDRYVKEQNVIKNSEFIMEQAIELEPKLKNCKFFQKLKQIDYSQFMKDRKKKKAEDNKENGKDEKKKKKKPKTEDPTKENEKLKKQEEKKKEQEAIKGT
jgi:hypothetical protein